MLSKVISASERMTEVQGFLTLPVRARGTNGDISISNDKDGQAILE
jgi:hypothetical protein